MYSWEGLDKTSLPDKENYSSFKLEDITEVNSKHAKNVFKYFNNENLTSYYDLYVQSDTCLLADVWKYMNLILLIFNRT